MSKGRDRNRPAKVFRTKKFAYVKPFAGGLFAVDFADLDLLDLCTWHIDGKHVASEIKGKKVYLHKLIGARLGFPKSKHVDHKNREPRDNRRHNLRPATRSLNVLNKEHLGSKVGIAGVYWDKINHVWDVRCGRDRRKVVRTLDEAIKLRLKWYEEKTREEELKAWNP